MHQYFYYAWVCWWDKRGSFRETGIDGFKMLPEKLTGFDWQDFREMIKSDFRTAVAEMERMARKQLTHAEIREKLASPGLTVSQQNYYAAILRNRCTWCDAKPVPGKRRCAACEAKNGARVKKTRAKVRALETFRLLVKL